MVIHIVSEKIFGVVKNQINRWNFNNLITELQQEAVFFRDAVEAPGIINGLRVQVEMILHPLSSPRSRVKKRNDAERTRDCLTQPLCHGATGDHLWVIPVVRVENIIPFFHERLLQTIANPPVYKIALLVEKHPIFNSAVVHADVVDKMFSHSTLDFPSRHVGIH